MDSVSELQGAQDHPAVSVRGLRRGYGTAEAVRGIDLEIARPEISALLGPNGAGKTTTLEILERSVDKTTRQFTAASYGQLYPKLQRLEQAGLIAGAAPPSGGRARTEYELTDAGMGALVDWLTDDREPVYELRDEGMLKLFFSDLVPDQQVPILRAMVRRSERKLAELRILEPVPDDVPAGCRMTLELGIGFDEWRIEGCEAPERRLTETSEVEAK